MDTSGIRSQTLRGAPGCPHSGLDGARDGGEAGPRTSRAPRTPQPPQQQTFYTRALKRKEKKKKNRTSANVEGGEEKKKSTRESVQLCNEEVALELEVSLHKNVAVFFRFFCASMTERRREQRAPAAGSRRLRVTELSGFATTAADCAGFIC